MQRTERGFAPRRPSAAAVVVLALHLLLGALLWQTLRHRAVSVRHEPAPLVWVRTQIAPPAASLPPPQSHDRTPRPKAALPRAEPLPAPTLPHESTWVPVPPPVAATPAAPPASAASDVPRLLDTEATRLAIRQTGRQALLQERAAAATGAPITRTDTALAAGVAEAGLSDCVKEGVPGGILGIPLLAAKVASGKCAK